MVQLSSILSQVLQQELVPTMQNARLPTRMSHVMPNIVKRIRPMK